MHAGRTPTPVFHIDPETGEFTKMTEQQMLTLSAIARATPKPLYAVGADHNSQKRLTEKQLITLS